MQLNFNLVLGTSQIGLALQAQLVDVTNTPVGAPITTGFHEIGVGNYSWLGTIPAGFQGGVVFRNTADNSIKAFVSINPNDTLVFQVDANGYPLVDVADWLGTPAPAFPVNVNVVDWLGAPAPAFPANFSVLAIDTSGHVTTAGGAGVNVTSWNGLPVLIGAGNLPLVTTLAAGVPLQVTWKPVQTVNFTVVQGDDYSNADGRALIWTSSIQNAWPDLTGATISWDVSDAQLLVQGTVLTATGMQQVMVEPTAAQTQVLDAGQYSYGVTAVLANGHSVTLAEGVLTVQDSERTALTV